MAVVGQVLLNSLAARIRGFIARVADGYNEAAHDSFGIGLVFVHCIMLWDRHGAPRFLFWAEYNSRPFSLQFEK
jgi:hypothetical protein